MASNRPSPKPRPRQSKLKEFYNEPIIRPLIQFSDSENDELYTTRSVASISSVGSYTRNPNNEVSEYPRRHNGNSVGSGSATYESRNAVDQLDAAHTMLDLERKQKQAKAFARQKELEAQMAQVQLELDTIELQTKHQKLRAKADILESYSIDERDEISNAIDNRSSVQTRYLNPTPRSRPAYNPHESAQSDTNQVQITPLRPVMMPANQLSNGSSDIRLLAESLKD